MNNVSRETLERDTMNKTIDVRPVFNDRDLADFNVSYSIKLNLSIDTDNMADISYIVTELTKATAHIEYELSKMKDSRKVVVND